MKENYLYFIKDEYFEKFENQNFLKNIKVYGDNEITKRPCYYAFHEGKILWMIPISSKIKKYENEYRKSMENLNF